MKSQHEIKLDNENTTYRTAGHYIIDENFNVYNNKQTYSYSRQCKILKWSNTEGYKSLKLSIEDETYSVGKHEIIYWFVNILDKELLEFLSEKALKRLEVDHIDSNNLNNDVKNLQLISYLENKFKVSVDNPNTFVKTPYLSFKRINNTYKGDARYSYSYCIHGIQAGNILNVKQSYRTYEEATKARDLYYSVIHPEIFQEIKLFESKYKEIIKLNIKSYLGYTANEIGQLKYRA